MAYEGSARVRHRVRGRVAPSREKSRRGPPSAVARGGPHAPSDCSAPPYDYDTDAAGLPFVNNRLRALVRDGIASTVAALPSRMATALLPAWPSRLPSI